MPQKHKNESIECAKNLLMEAIELFDIQNYNNALKNLSSAHKIFLANKDIKKVSVCLSLTGLINFIDKTESYYRSLLLLEDSKFIAQSSEDSEVIAVNKFAFGYIYFLENKLNDAMFYLTDALEQIISFPVLKIKACEILADIYMKLQSQKAAYQYIEQAMEYANTYGLKNIYKRLTKLSEKFIKGHSPAKYKHLTRSDNNQSTTLLLALSKIARTLNAQVSLDNLLITIAEQTSLVLNADRCTVFLYDKEKNELWSKVALGMASEEIRFSADKGFAGHVLKTGETIIIQDAYKDSRFNKEIDKKTGYRTYNILCMPIRNIKYEIIGVFQVLNKKDGDFTEADEDILLAIGTNAGIAIENSVLFNIQQKMIDEQQKLFTGFIDTLAASIDARDKITLGHSNRVRQYSELICKEMGLDEEFTGIVSKSAMLHDIGKIGIRDSVLQKKGALTKEEYEHIKEHVKITYDILCKANMNSSFTEIAEIASSHHEKYDGTGYFRGLKGEQIPLGGRILAVSDVFDAITSVRHYRDRMPMKDALGIIFNGSGKHFDAKIVDVFFNIHCDIIMDVLITEYEMTLKDKDRKILKSYNLKQFYEILNKDTINPKEQNLIDIFDSYYLRNKETAAVYE